MFRRWSSRWIARPPPRSRRSTGGPHAAMFSAVLRAALGDDRPIRVTMTGTPPAWAPGPAARRGRFPMGGPMGPAGMHRFPPDGVAFLIQVRLQDGTWATFDTQVTQAVGDPAVARAADPCDPARRGAAAFLRRGALGHAPAATARYCRRRTRARHQPPAIAGRRSHSRSAAPHALSTPCRPGWCKLIDERTRLLTAMSHDLKTPLTRMRLRAEMLEDGNLREKFEADLLEMESMVTQTLEFMRGLSNREPAQLVDIMGLLESAAGRQRSDGPHCHYRRTHFQTLLRRTAAPQALRLQSRRQRCPLR